VGPRDGLDAVARRKIPSPRRESNPCHPIVQPVASRYTDWAEKIKTYEVRILNRRGPDEYFRGPDFVHALCVDHAHDTASLNNMRSISVPDWCKAIALWGSRYRRTLNALRVIQLTARVLGMMSWKLVDRGTIPSAPALGLPIDRLEYWYTETLLKVLDILCANPGVTGPAIKQPHWLCQCDIATDLWWVWGPAEYPLSDTRLCHVWKHFNFLRFSRRWKFEFFWGFELCGPHVLGTRTTRLTLRGHADRLTNQLTNKLHGAASSYRS
jgi:hypothetical protein